MHASPCRCFLCFTEPSPLLFPLVSLPEECGLCSCMRVSVFLVFQLETLLKERKETPDTRDVVDREWTGQQWEEAVGFCVPWSPKTNTTMPLTDLWPLTRVLLSAPTWMALPATKNTQELFWEHDLVLCLVMSLVPISYCCTRSFSRFVFPRLHAAQLHQKERHTTGSRTRKRPQTFKQLYCCKHSRGGWIKWIFRLKPLPCCIW